MDSPNNARLVSSSPQSVFRSSVSCRVSRFTSSTMQIGFTRRRSNPSSRFLFRILGGDRSGWDARDVKFCFGHVLPASTHSTNSHHVPIQTQWQTVPWVRSPTVALQFAKTIEHLKKLLGFTGSRRRTPAAFPISRPVGRWKLAHQSEPTNSVCVLTCSIDQDPAMLRHPH